MIYKPDKYMLIKIHNEEETLYKVFGTWLGSYLNGDYWRMNSGIVSVIQEGDNVTFVGSSGSEYKVHKDSVGCSAFTASVLNSALKIAEDTDYTMEVVDLDEVVREVGSGDKGTS